MRPCVSFTLAAVLAVYVSASPTQSRRGLIIPLTKRSEFSPANLAVKPQILRTNVQASVDKILRGFASYEINTGTVHSLASTSVSSKRAAVADTLTDMANYGLWQGAVSVGTPPVAYTVDFDTGSTDMFLPGPNCATNCAGHQYYYPGNSSTSAYVGATFTLQYGDGSSVTGVTYTDTVTISSLSATAQTIGAASTYSNGFASANFPPDGLLGLAWKQLSVYGANGYFQTLVAEGQVTSAVFAFKLTTGASELYLGGVNAALYTGSFTWVPVVQQAYWQVALSGISVNGAQVVASTQSIIDTGTTLIVGPTAGVAAFYAAIPGSAPAPQYGTGIYTVPCTAIPSISLTFGGTTFSVSAATFNFGSVGANQCIGGVAATSGFNFWIVGDVFLQNVYTAFDVGASRVGFATLA